MEHRTDELRAFGEALRAARRPFEVAERFFADRGIRGFMYAYAPTRRAIDEAGMTQGFHFHHTYPEQWEAEIGLEALLDNDVPTDAMVSGVTEFEWTPEALHTRMEEFSPAQQAQLRIEYEMGFHHGMSLLLGGSATGISAIGLWADTQRSSAQFRREWAGHGESLRGASQMLDIVIRGERPNAVVGLTAREREVVQLLAVGLRGDQIAHRLTIADRTLEKHVTNAKAKLKARTRDQMVARAILMGLLDH